MISKQFLVAAIVAAVLAMLMSAGLPSAAWLA